LATIELAMSWGTDALLFAAALLAGVLNAMAGGGTFITFPALVWAGVPAVAANATSTLAAFPGYASSSWGFRHELASLPRRTVFVELLIAAVGGVLGALLLLVTPATTFNGLVPWLLLFATLAFLLAPKLQALQTMQRRAASWRRPGLALASIYGGYFNGGLGIVLMAVYSVCGERLNASNALKNLLSAVLAVWSVVAFTLAGLIAWRAALVMMVATTIGGLLGARMAQRMPTRGVRWVVIATGGFMTIAFFVRAYGN
jgi:uncharacterized membrane protein YfcA